MHLNRVDFARYCLSLHTARTNAAYAYKGREGGHNLFHAEYTDSVRRERLMCEQRAAGRLRHAKLELCALGK